MNPQIEGLEDALDAILEAVEELIASGQPIPQELQDLVAEEITALTQDIEQIYSQQESGQQEPFQGQQLNEAPISDNLNLVWLLAGGRQDYFIDYLTNFPDPEFRTLLHNPGRLEATIQHLLNHNPIPNQGPQHGIPKSELNSSNVFGVKYDFGKKKLLFVHDFNNGSVLFLWILLHKCII